MDEEIDWDELVEAGVVTVALPEVNVVRLEGVGIVPLTSVPVVFEDVVSEE